MAAETEANGPTENNSNFSTGKLSLDSIICPICREIMCLPVTMGCSHEMCKDCYDFHFKLANFNCPLCKKRLSSWARKAVKEGKLINMAKWNQIQEQFPHLIQQKNLGTDIDIQNELECKKVISAPGEIRKEYISCVEKWKVEEQNRRELEEEASMKLIKQLQEEEQIELNKENERKIKKDKELAKKLTQELQMNISPGGVNRIILRPKRRNEKLQVSKQKKCKQK